MKRALVIGSINIDSVYELEHIVRPGETVSSRKYRTAWGGKGLNQAIALSRGGAETALAGCVGAAELEALVAVCAEARVDAARIRARSVTTGHAIIRQCAKLHYRRAGRKRNSGHGRYRGLS